MAKLLADGLLTIDNYHFTPSDNADGVTPVTVTQTIDDEVAAGIAAYFIAHPYPAPLQSVEYLITTIQI